MSKLEVVRFAAGTQLFAQGQVPEAMYFVLQGTVELANEHTDLVGQGALVGAVAFLNQILPDSGPAVSQTPTCSS